MTKWEEGAIVPMQSTYKRPDATFIVAEPKPDNYEELQLALNEYRQEGYLACYQRKWIVIGWDRIRSPKSITD